MKFPSPPHTGHSRRQRVFSKRRGNWWHKCCGSHRTHLFKPRQTPRAKLRTFDKWISIIFITLLILAVLMIQLVTHLNQSRHAAFSALHVVDLTQSDTISNKPKIPVTTTNKFAHLVTNIKPNQKNILQQNDITPETNVSLPSLSQQYQHIQNAIVQSQTDNQNEITNKEFSDWWQCPIVNSDSPKYIAYRELQDMRKHLIHSKLHDADSILSVSNAINPVTECVVFKEVDPTHQWHPNKDDLCPWHNTALFWTAMAGTHIGVQIRKMESTSLENHWMFEFKNHMPRNCVCPQNILFLYTNNINENDMFIHSMNKCDDECLVYKVTAQKREWTLNKDFNDMLQPILAFIDNEIAMKLAVEYVMFVSGDDTTLMLQDFDMDSTVDLGKELVERFTDYDCEMLICGAANSYPHWQRDAQGFENTVNRWSRHHQHINSNIFMVGGGMHNFKKYVHMIKTHYDAYDSDKMKWSFQAAIRELHQINYPKIKIDSLAKIWTRVDEWMCDP
eukprot:487575_1